MMPTLSTRLSPGLPKLAWLATVDRDTARVRVRHGRGVEVRPRFVVEGVWDAPFAHGGFHRAEHFFGSGIRVDERGVWLVPSHALVDRIVYCERGRTVLASNSLALLLAETGARLDPDWDYRRESFTILDGIDEYDPSFRMLHPEIEEFRQLYHRPLVIDAGRAYTVGREAIRRFASFEEYVGSVRTGLRRVHANIGDAERRVPLTVYTTASAGYDSTAVTALVHDLDVRACYTSRRSNSSITPWISRRAAIDDGATVAARFGLPLRYLDRPRGEIGEDELFFLAPTAADPELIFHGMAREIERESAAAVVFTGFHGDKIWDVHTGDPYLGPAIRRGDISGLNLTEIRLKAGFINSAVPFMHARSVGDVVAIARSPAMEPWRLHNDYDRPVPRRILEDAGVPRRVFGQRKKAVVQKYNYPVDPTLRRSFFAWIRERRGWSRPLVHLHDRVNKPLFLIARLGERVLARVGVDVPEAPTAVVGRSMDLPYELHVWALEALAHRLARCLPGESATPAAAAVTHPGTGPDPWR